MLWQPISDIPEILRAEATKSPWSEKNKKLVDKLCESKIMTELREKAVEAAKKDGTTLCPPLSKEPIQEDTSR